MVSLGDLPARFDRAIGAGLEPVAPAAPGGLPAWTDDDVRRAVGELPESFRSAVLLVEVEDLSYEEAAEVLGCPVGTVRSRLSRARRLLFVRLEEHARRLGYGRTPGEA